MKTVVSNASPKATWRANVTAVNVTDIIVSDFELTQQSTLPIAICARIKRKLLHVRRA